MENKVKKSGRFSESSGCLSLSGYSLIFLVLLYFAFDEFKFEMKFEFFYNPIFYLVFFIFTCLNLINYVIIRGYESEVVFYYPFRVFSKRIAIRYANVLEVSGGSKGLCYVIFKTKNPERKIVVSFFSLDFYIVERIDKFVKMKMEEI